MDATKRFYFLDNLRVALTVLLIAHHVGQTYGPTGGFWPIQEPTRALILGPFFTVNRSFFMSLFFLVSGFLMARSYDARAGRGFVRSRLLRLGLPLLVFTLLMIPVQLFLLRPDGVGSTESAWPIDVSYLWYVEHLLLFSLGYAVWRALPGRRSAAEPAPSSPPRVVSILLFALGLAAASATVRIWFPIDRWVFLLGFVRVAFADLPRDLAFFVIGVLAYRRQWLSTFSTKAGRAWLALSLFLAALCYGYQLGISRIAPLSDLAMSVVYPVWEALLCCGLCIGLVVLFRDRFDSQGRLTKELGRSQYAAYLFHVPVILGFQYLVLKAVLPPLAKFALVTLASVPLTFLVASAVRKPLHL